MSTRRTLQLGLAVLLAWSAHGALADDLLPRRPFAFTQEMIARLPLGEGSEFAIAQGYNAQRQSAPADRRYVVGLKLKSGTVVTAVADGTISEVSEQDGNVRVVVTQFDGTQAYYIGLTKQGLAAATGSAVRSGALLGRSSELLYFALVTGSGDAIASQPLIFINGEPPVDFIEARTGTVGVVNYVPKPAAPAPEPVATAPDPAPVALPVAAPAPPKPPNPISLAPQINQRALDEADNAPPPPPRPKPPRTFFDGILSLWPLALMVAGALAFNAYRNAPAAPKRAAPAGKVAFWRRKPAAAPNDNSVR